MKKLMFLMVMVMVFTRMGISQSQIVVPATTYQEESKKAVKAETADTLTKRNTSVSIFGPQRQEEKKTYGIGFQVLNSVGSAISVWGISIMSDITPRMSIQVLLAPFSFSPGLLSPFGDPKMYVGKFIYRDKKELYWNAYVYGMVSALDYYESSKTFNFKAGVGTGIEFNWKALYSKLPSIAWNLEIGGLVGRLMENYKTKRIDIIVESGFHYHF